MRVRSAMDGDTDGDTDGEIESEREYGGVGSEREYQR